MSVSKDRLMITKLLCRRVLRKAMRFYLLMNYSWQECEDLDGLMKFDQQLATKPLLVDWGNMGNSVIPKDFASLLMGFILLPQLKKKDEREGEACSLAALL